MRKQKQARFLARLAVLVMLLSLLCCNVFATEEGELPPEQPAQEEPAEQPAPGTPEEQPAEEVPAEQPPQETPTEAPATEPPTEAPTEPTTETPVEPEPTEPEPTEPAAKEPEKEPRSMFQFTPDGQLTLVDDFEYVGMDTDGNVMSKQFITVQARDGSYFYIIIDRTGDTENVHFLNQVDLADLQAAANGASGTRTVFPSQCICTSTCVSGHINMDCPVCSVNMTKCAAVDPIPQDGKEQEADQTSPKDDGLQPKDTTTQAGPSYTKIVIGAAILIAIVVYLLKGNVFSSGKKAAPPREYDEYDDEYDEDEEEADEESEEAPGSDDVEYEFVEEDEDAEEFEDDTELS